MSRAALAAKQPSLEEWAVMAERCASAVALAKAKAALYPSEAVKAEMAALVQCRLKVVRVKANLLVEV
jgi:hypothetical protein